MGYMLPMNPSSTGDSLHISWKHYSPVRLLRCAKELGVAPIFSDCMWSSVDHPGWIFSSLVVLQVPGYRVHTLVPGSHIQPILSLDPQVWGWDSGTGNLYSSSGVPMCSHV